MRSFAAYAAYRPEYVSWQYFLSDVYTRDQDMNYQGSTCICRVPKAQVRSGTIVECVHCGTFKAALAAQELTFLHLGCRGCSSDS